MDIRGYDSKKAYRILDSYICDDREQTYESHGRKIKPGAKVTFKSISGLGLTNITAPDTDVEGTITYVNHKHNWFSVEYGDRKAKTSFNFGDIGHTVMIK